jgi:branched-chain amino acid transport system permease protein
MIRLLQRTLLNRAERALVIGGVLFAIALVLPHVVYPVLAINLICFALFAVAFDLLLGFTGLLSFGHAMFWGGSAYIGTLLIAKLGASFPVALVGGIVYSAVLALVVGLIAIRRTGIYFAMITLAIAQVQYFFALQLSDITGGENGLPIATRGGFFGLSLESDMLYYYVALAFVVLGVAFVVRVTASPFGAVLAAMRENENRALGLGYRTDRYKLATFVMSGALAGLAGTLYALGNHLTGLDAVDWHTSGKVVMMTILGGIGTIFGPALGAGIFESLEYFVSKTAIGDKTNIVMGSIFLVIVLVARRGIVGEVIHALRPKLVEEDDDTTPGLSAFHPVPSAGNAP